MTAHQKICAGSWRGELETHDYYQLSKYGFYFPVHLWCRRIYLWYCDGRTLVMAEEAHRGFRTYGLT